MVAGPSLIQIAHVFAGIVDTKSPWTQRHSERTADIAAAVAETLGWPLSGVEAARLAALWHDLGKLGVSNLILDKPGPLTDDERRAMARHPAWTAAILEPLTPFAAIREGAAGHHERIDGTGYPHRWRGDAVPTLARVVAVADVFEALTAARPYKEPYAADEAIALMRREAGSHLDPAAVEALAATRPSGPDPAADQTTAAVPME
jgi:HD-GYP domain-containing protein (c-di-GMP phosphodiesterase class II)